MLERLNIPKEGFEEFISKVRIVEKELEYGINNEILASLATASYPSLDPKLLVGTSLVGMSYAAVCYGKTAEDVIKVYATLPDLELVISRSDYLYDKLVQLDKEDKMLGFKIAIDGWCHAFCKGDTRYRDCFVSAVIATIARAVNFVEEEDTICGEGKR